MNKPVSSKLPSNLPTNWKLNDIIAPEGESVGLSEQHGYNYFNQQVNDSQTAINAINDAFAKVQELPNSLSSVDSLAAADLLALFDISASGSKKVTVDALRKYFESFINKAYTTSGTGAAFTVTNTEINTLHKGQILVIVPHTSSTTTAPTLTVNSGTAYTIKRRDSSGAAVAGDAQNWLPSGATIPLMYTGSEWIVLDRSQPKASDLSGTVAIGHGGTGATTAAAARTALGVPPTNHATTSTNYGVGNATNYGHVKLSDIISNNSAGDGFAATPGAVAFVKELVRRKNYLHNWDFSSPYIAGTNQRVGTGDFLGRWYSATAGNSLTVNINSGLSYFTSTANGYFSQIVTRELANFFSRAVNFSVYFASIPASTAVQIALYAFDASGNATTVATASANGSTFGSGILSCTGSLPATYDRLECRILLGTANKTIIIQKAKLEVGSESTLSGADVADVAEQALLCRVTNASGQYIGGTNVIASASLV